jgi:hypothetical protein
MKPDIFHGISRLLLKKFKCTGGGIHRWMFKKVTFYFGNN